MLGKTFYSWKKKLQIYDNLLLAYKELFKRWVFCIKELDYPKKNI